MKRSERPEAGQNGDGGVFEVVRVDRREGQHQQRGEWRKADVPFVPWRRTALAPHLAPLQLAHACPVLRIGKHLRIEVEPTLEPSLGLVNEMRGLALAPEALRAEAGEQHVRARKQRQLDAKTAEAHNLGPKAIKCCRSKSNAWYAAKARTRSRSPGRKVRCHLEPLGPARA